MNRWDTGISRLGETFEQSRPPHFGGHGVRVEVVALDLGRPREDDLSYAQRRERCIEALQNLRTREREE